MRNSAGFELLAPFPDQPDCIHGASNPAPNAREVGQDALQVETSKRLLRGEASGPANIVRLQIGTGRGDLRLGHVVDIHCVGDLPTEDSYSVPFARDPSSGRVWVGAGQYTDFIRR